MTQLNRDPNTDPRTLTKDLAAQNETCHSCGKNIENGNVNISPYCGSQPSRNPYAAGIMNGQQPNQPGHALYSYCKVKRNPRLVPVAVAVTVFEGVIITLLILSAGVTLGRALFIGGFFSALFAFVFWYAKRLQTGAVKRVNAYLAADGGRSMFSDFASAQPFANDQFRVGRQYLFLKNSAVLRLDSISDIIRINHHYRMFPTGVSLSVKVSDEHGRMAFPLCRLHMLNAQKEIAEIRQAVMQRRH